MTSYISASILHISSSIITLMIQKAFLTFYFFVHKEPKQSFPSSLPFSLSHSLSDFAGGEASWAQSSMNSSNIAIHKTFY